ncbi:MAG: molecular chaperone DnaJ [Chloroflexi bacterium]|nr:molecular chaperone DnaJ [Chloroflexota bacterium]
MATQKDYYNLLGVPRDATEEQIRRAFRGLAMEWHPDRNKAKDAAERFKEINEAYQVLIDPEKRRMYDRFGRADVDPNSGWPGRGFDGFDFPGGVGDIFDAFFGGFRGQANTSAKGRDLQYSMTITFEEAALGVEREVQITRQEICGTCHGDLAEPGTQKEQCANCGGSGQVRRTQSSVFGQFMQVVACSACRGLGQTILSPCTGCRGTGREKSTRKVMVNVPAGVEDGMRVRLAGEGDAGVNGGRPGDVFVSLSVKPHLYFRRDKENLVFDLPLNVAHAALGTTIEVPMLEGERETFEVPAGVQSGAILRKRGKGVPNLHNGRPGDLIGLVTVMTPQKMGPRTRELFEELSESLDEDEEAYASNGVKSWFRKLKDVLTGEST